MTLEYKDASPEQTIQKIKNILKDIGINTKELLYNNAYLSHSCRIIINNDVLSELNVGTNGKGMTPAYSLASGYAELMERLQNKSLLNEAIKHAIPSSTFQLFPDEKEQTSSKANFISLINTFFPNYQPKRYANKLPEQISWLGVPFANITKKQVEVVPIILLSTNSSTGMCAGNTPYEAILQGINEIFERYVLQKLYLEKITPPVYSPDYFKGTAIHSRLEKLVDMGYIYEVRDCSLGKGFPVIGLQLTNTSNGTITFRLGADLSPEIALERCFTEIFQGREQKDAFFTPIELDKPINIPKEYHRNLKNGTGRYPTEFFFASPSYEFNEPVITRTGDSQDDFHAMVDFLERNGYSLLIRDHSFLGFPTYQIIIPGLSDQHYKLNDILDDYIQYLNSNKPIWSLYRLKQLNKKELEQLPTIIEEKYPDEYLIKLFPYNTSSHNVINKDLLIFLIYIKLNDYERAYKYFTSFLDFYKSKEARYNDYLHCVRDYIYLKKNHEKDVNIRSALSKFYTTKKVDEVFSDFKSTQKIMKNYLFPECFDCENCPIKSSCHYKRVIQFATQILNIQTINRIYQDQLLTL
ncbi:YcaO-like family protein [Bacteroides ovatus]|nr:YcaO-like family protein [Bacteroides ovatus]